MSTTNDQMRVSKGRCFSMCEPDDLSQRDDKLMKPIVVNDGDIPTRFFLYLFPEEPKFNTSEVGEPGFLTPLIKAGKIAEARKQAAVHLKEYPQMESYAGFFNVNPKYNSHLYFWFFPSQNRPSSDPIIIWLQVHYILNSVLLLVPVQNIIHTMPNMLFLGRPWCHILIWPFQRKWSN